MRTNEHINLIIYNYFSNQKKSILLKKYLNILWFGEELF